ncbi:DUF551 domain-containing protein [Cronobacter dublinensis]
MITISNERVEFYATNEPPFGYTGSDINAMARELLALRKEREAAVPEFYGPYTPAMIGAGVWVTITDELPPQLEGCEVWVTTALPAPPVADDSLPFDPQIAEYEQMMEAEQAQADTTSQQSESLAGKAVGGWIPCSERMPDFYYSCLAADEHGDMVIGLPNNLKVSYRKAFRLSGGELFFATHWQPLPEPPCK